MADKPKERDWDKELAEVDRLIAKNLPQADPSLGRHAPAPHAGPGAAAHSTPGHALPAARASAGQWLGTWVRVGLGVLIGIGMTQWPYTHGCGLKLMFYLIGVAAVITTGVWSSLSSWRRRLGVAHVLSQVLIVWGLVLAARELLPRVGYAKAAATWLCQ
ncbi:MAG TPA: hypothetical protein VEO93_08260 [Gemmatimonadales bacterium]|nr:hypothetical protein [Gemmatimonadales bacterium]